MATGKVIQFDEYRGYGFIAPETGGEDVFMHVNDLETDKRLVTSGSVVEFVAEESDRGPKASHVRVIQNPATTSASAIRTVNRGDGEIHVLTAKEFSHEVTEALLSAVPDMTADQILAARQRLLGLGRSHNWVD